MKNKISKIGAMEPLMPEESQWGNLIDLAVELTKQASALAARLHPIVAESVGHLVRSMNCYYSNLIEGHDTHPRDIDRALANHFSHDNKKRILQLEAKAHIEVQQLLDSESVSFSTSSHFIRYRRSSIWSLA